MSSHMSQSAGRKRSPIIPIIIGLVVVAAGVVGFLFATGFFTPKVEVPSLSYMDQEEAMQALTDAGLKLGTVSEEESEEMKMGGFVVRQDPEPGASAKEGSAVNIVLSIGPLFTDPVVVPDIMGLTPEEAESRLLDAMIMPQPGEPVYNADVEPGKVCVQSIPAGTSIAMLETVTYQTSLGEEKVTVPDVVGVAVADARTTITQAGLAIDSTEVYNDQVDKDIVVSQSVAAGEQVSKGATVTIEVSLGARPAAKVVVPNVYTYDLASAKRTLESAGLAYRVTGDEDGTVVSVSPAPGAQVDQGSTVEIGIKRPEPQPQPTPQPEPQPTPQPEPTPEPEPTPDEPAISDDIAVDLATLAVLGPEGGEENVECSGLLNEGGVRFYRVEFDADGAHYTVLVDADDAEVYDIAETDAEGATVHYDGNYEPTYVE